MAESGRRQRGAGGEGEEGGEGARRASARDDGAGDGSLASQASENDEEREREKNEDGAKTPKRASLQKVLQPKQSGQSRRQCRQKTAREGLSLGILIKSRNSKGKFPNSLSQHAPPAGEATEVGGSRGRNRPQV